METTADLLFYVFAAITVLPAFVVVFSRNLLYSAFSLLFTLSGVAALYGLLGADFLAVTQVLVYVGGILVLILFGVMFTQKVYDVRAEAMSFKRRRAAIVGIAVFASLVAVGRSVDWPLAEGRQVVPTSATIGDLLLSEYLLPFEVISVLLLVVLIGAVVVGKKEVEGE
ncbi:MAG: NADH-quinone oxidoreductase subunit J [Candidatus Krumholzibacteriia bacterium]